MLPFDRAVGSLPMGKQSLCQYFFYICRHGAMAGWKPWIDWGKKDDKRTAPATYLMGI